MGCFRGPGGVQYGCKIFKIAPLFSPCNTTQGYPRGGIARVCVVNTILPLLRGSLDEFSIIFQKIMRLAMIFGHLPLLGVLTTIPRPSRRGGGGG